MDRSYDAGPFCFRKDGLGFGRSSLKVIHSDRHFTGFWRAFDRCSDVCVFNYPKMGIASAHPQFLNQP